MKMKEFKVLMVCLDYLGIKTVKELYASMRMYKVKNLKEYMGILQDIIIEKIVDGE